MFYVTPNNQLFPRILFLLFRNQSKLFFYIETPPHLHFHKEHQNLFPKIRIKFLVLTDCKNLTDHKGQEWVDWNLLNRKLLKNQPYPTIFPKISINLERMGGHPDFALNTFTIFMLTDLNIFVWKLTNIYRCLAQLIC